MNKGIYWLKAARLRTLPLSLSGIIVGNGLAYAAGNFRFSIFVLACLTTIVFQVLSNFANDYGDGVKGTDNDDRLGPERMLQAGLISKKAMKRGVQITALLGLLMSAWLIGLSFGENQWIEILFFLGLGIASIVAAIKYTVGDTAYGYYALGDLFVFLFFGGVSVMGSFYLQTMQLDLSLVFPVISIGFLSVAVLNLNNMRDHENDAKMNKITLPVILGIQKAKYYHLFLIVGAFFSTLIHLYFYTPTVWGYAAILPFLVLARHLVRVFTHQSPKAFDPELKVVALSTFFIALLWAVSQGI